MEPKLLGRLLAGMPGNNGAIFVHQKRHRPSKLPDGLRELRDLPLGMRPSIFLIRFQPAQRHHFNGPG